MKHETSARCLVSKSVKQSTLYTVWLRYHHIRFSYLPLIVPYLPPLLVGPTDDCTVLFASLYFSPGDSHIWSQMENRQCAYFHINFLLSPLSVYLNSHIRSQITT